MKSGNWNDKIVIRMTKTSAPLKAFCYLRKTLLPHGVSECLTVCQRSSIDDILGYAAASINNSEFPKALVRSKEKDGMLSRLSRGVFSQHVFPFLIILKFWHDMCDKRKRLLLKHSAWNKFPRQIVSVLKLLGLLQRSQGLQRQ